MQPRNQRTSSASGRSAESGESSAGEDDIAQFVQEFRAEVDAKFKKSATNAAYVFPRRPEKSASKRELKNESADSLRGVQFYDLESQNTKESLLGLLGQKRNSETRNLVAVVRELGRLDPRYLDSQLRNCESTFFKLLYRTVQKKAAKDFKSKDSLNSCSVKTRQIFATERLKSAKGTKRDEHSASFQQHFLSSEALTKAAPAAKVPSLQQMVLAGAAQNRTLLHPESATRGKNVSVSPRLRSRLDVTGKNLKSEKQLAKPSPSLMRSGVLKTSGLNTSSQAKIASGKQETVSVFQAVRANFVKTKEANSKSKSRIKTPRPTAEARPVQLKNQISLTKEQLRSLIQKNIYKAPAPDQEQLRDRANLKGDGSSDGRRRNPALNLQGLKGRLALN